MDYKLLYNNFIEYCKNVDARQRLYNRNKNDYRLKLSKIYTEAHHIIPKHDNGDNNICNIVNLLPEEHYIAHKIRYKAFKQRGDFIAVKLIIITISDKKYSGLDERMIKRLKDKYSWIKQHSREFRNTIGWQSEDGVRRISEARKGTFPAVDAITRESVGSISVNHPKYLSGEWVHHSKGMKAYKNISTGESVFLPVKEGKLLSSSWKPIIADQSGDKNTRYSGMTDDDIFYCYEEGCKLMLQLGYCYFPPSSVANIISMKKFGRKIPSLTGGLRSGFRFNGDFKHNCVYVLCNKYNIQYKPTNKLNKNELEKINAYYRRT